LNRFVDLDEILFGADAVGGNIDMKTSNPIASTNLNWSRFKFVWWMHYLHHSALLNNGLGLFTIAGFP
jgi:hypothetical protein